jgi:GTP cyclohydrolase I
MDLKLFNCNHNQVLTKEQKIEMIKLAAIQYRKFMVALGIDIENDPNSRGTPLRVAKMMVTELCKGRYNKKPNIRSFPNQEQYDQIIFTNCETISLCAHHMVPIQNKIFIGVLSNPDPNSRLIGLSKYTRIAEWIANRPTIQEDMTKQIHNEINNICEKNKGVMVYIIGQHGCTTFRGVKQTNAKMITSCVSGAFKEDQSVKDEFMNMVNNVLRSN